MPADPAWPTWFTAAARADVDSALRAFYADLDAEVARGEATCDQSGRCCKFDSFGHRLYVTALEIAWFTRMADGRWRMADGEDKPASGVRLPVLPARDHDACVYQIDGLCSQHTIRPLGCRVFFCQAGTEDWQHDLYERYLARLKVIHEQFGVPYRYMEWRAGLDEALASRPTSAPN